MHKDWTHLATGIGYFPTFSKTAMKKPPVSEWWGSMRMHRSRGSDAESAFGNMLLVSF